MLSKELIIIPILFFSWCTQAQVATINGKVTDRMLNPIEFVSLGIIGTQIGTVTDKTGSFSLYVDKNSVSDKDSLKFSMIGYYPKSIAINKMIEENESEPFSIVLDDKVEQLKETVISATRLKSEIIGSHHKGLINMDVNFAISQYPDQNLGSEIGRKFSIPNKNTELLSFRFYLSTNNYDSVKFRINIYKINNSIPGENILSQNIYTDVIDKKKGWIDVDLSMYNIIVDEDVIISIEWVQKAGNGNSLSLPITMPSSHIHFYKFGSQNEWKRFESMTTPMELSIRY